MFNSISGITPLLLGLEVFLTAKGWYKCSCSLCSRVFFSKSKESNICTWRKCSSPNAIVNFSEGRKNPKKLTEVNNLLTKTLNKFGHVTHSALLMNDKSINTDLVSAGVQILSSAFNGDASEVAGKSYVVSQPCMRLNILNKVDEELAPDVATSFVNVCTESLGRGHEEHLQSIDHWITALSKIGLHADSMRLVVRDKVENWGLGEFHSHQLFFVYKGVEIGDAGFAGSFPSNPVTTLSDIGFGLERLTWVVNSFPEFMTSYTSDGLGSRKDFQDTCRSISLLLTNGVEPTGRGAGGNLRWLIKRARKLGDTANMIRCVHHFSGFWVSFGAKQLRFEDIYKILSAEADLDLVREIKSAFGVNPNHTFSLVDLIDTLVYTRGIKPEVIQQFISQKS